MDKLQPIKIETIETYELSCPHGCGEPFYLVVTFRQDSIVKTPMKYQVTHYPERAHG